MPPGDRATRPQRDRETGGAGRLLDRLAPGRFGGRLGLAVVALGLLVIGVGWNGAAGSGGEVNHVPLVQAQLPWLLSGGFLGLGVVVLGAALIIVSAHRDSQANLKSTLDAVADAIERLRHADPATPTDVGDLVVGGSASYHGHDCSLVAGRADTRLLTLQEAVDDGLIPCRVCRPPVVVETTPETASEVIARTSPETSPGASL